jgi:hypothetical protein
VHTFRLLGDCKAIIDDASGAPVWSREFYRLEVALRSAPAD